MSQLGRTLEKMGSSATFFKEDMLREVFEKMVPWKEEEFDSLIPYAKQIRNRFTVFNTL